jgi:hypothetical protein
MRSPLGSVLRSANVRENGAGVVYVELLFLAVTGILGSTDAQTRLRI